MKRLLLSLWLLAAGLSPGHAQQAPPEDEAPITSFATAINDVFTALDKSPARIPSGMLEDYGLQVIDHLPLLSGSGQQRLWPANCGGLWY